MISAISPVKVNNSQVNFGKTDKNKASYYKKPSFASEIAADFTIGAFVGAVMQPLMKVYNLVTKQPSLPLSAKNIANSAVTWGLAYVVINAAFRAYYNFKAHKAHN